MHCERQLSAAHGLLRQGRRHYWTGRGVSAQHLGLAGPGCHRSPPGGLLCLLHHLRPLQVSVQLPLLLLQGQGLHPRQHCLTGKVFTQD